MPCAITGEGCVVNAGCCWAACEIAPGATSGAGAPPCRAVGLGCAADLGCCGGLRVVPAGGTNGARGCGVAP